MSLRHGRGVILSLAVAVTFACGFRPDEFDCEDAASHLKQCCPGFDPTSIRCDYETSSCGTVYPDFDEDQSRCIRSKSCDTLRATGICDRALQVHGSSRPLSPTGVCPGTGPLTAPDDTCATTADCKGGYVCCLGGGLLTCVEASYCAAATDAAPDAPSTEVPAEATDD